MTYSLHRGAADDVAEAARFYRREGGRALEIRFANEFEHVAKLVSKNPGLENPGSGLVSCISAVNTLKSFGCGRLTVIVGDASVALAWVLPDTE